MKLFNLHRIVSLKICNYLISNCLFSSLLSSSATVSSLLISPLLILIDILHFHCIILIRLGDINWKDFSLLLPFLALIVGVLSSLLGIGGGELMGPLMLHLKVRVMIV